MNRRLLEFRTPALVLAAGFFFSQFAFADGAPNAWQVADNSAVAFVNYTNQLSDDLQIAATNVGGGFDYVINARLLAGSVSAETLAMGYGLETNRFLIWFSLDTNGDLTADLDGAGTYTLTTNGTGTALYHYHEILYNPATAQASYLFDGRVMTTNWSATTNSLDSGQIFWGAGSAPGTGTMNIHAVTFKITNTVVAAYDAGIGGSPATAPDPALSGWLSNPDVPPADTAVTNISPDTVPLPSNPLPTTLDATNVAVHAATLLGAGDQGNLAATVWFEWGTDTNYGNTTPPQALLSDTNHFNLSQTIIGLAKGTAYHFRCVATNLLGIAYGQDDSFITSTAIIVTNSADAGPGTLRQAIADSTPGDAIAITLDHGSTITLTNGPLLITNDLTIVASNAAVAIDGGGSSRVMEIASNTVVLDWLTITNGFAPDFGGGILVDDGAILTVTNCTVANNVASAGGGIFLSGNNTVAICNCFFSANSATNTGGAIDNETNSALTISGSVFAGNSAQNGGAIFNNLATNLVDSCAFSGNSAENGGAIANFDSALTGTRLSVSNNFASSGGGIFNGNNDGLLTLSNSTLSGNLGTNFGGGIVNSNGCKATINNSTISDNACPADQGGGVDNFGTITVNNCTISGSPSGGGLLNFGGAAVCNNSTFSGNFALFDGGGYYAYFGTNILNNCTISGNSAKRRAGGIYEYNSSSVLRNTIVAGNSATISSPDLLGSISGKNNLIGVNPLLAPLGDYGGPTQTMPPLNGSPAINAGMDSIANFLTTDQRGYPRLASSHVDIGAVEIQPALVLNTNDDGPGSFRAVAASNPIFITFTNSLSGQTIALTNGQITLSNSVGIDASSLTGGIIIDAGGASRVLEISASNIATLDSLTITNGSVSGNGGGILMDDGVSLTLNHCTVAGNSAATGGGIAQISGNLTVNNSTVSRNTATQNGGGVAIIGGAATLNNCTLFGNSGSAGGGMAVGAGATDTLTNCTVTGNSADDGGGIAQDLLSVSTLVNTIVAGNTAPSDPDIIGPFIGANNLITDNPLLASLGNYGGPTQTMPPLAGSAAIDAGLDSVVLGTDQRGYSRFSGAHVDIGAVESQVAPGGNRPVLRLSRIQAGGGFSLTFTNISIADFTILSSTNIALPVNHWDVLGPAIQNSPGSYQFTDSRATNDRVRFYRVVSP